MEMKGKYRVGQKRKGMKDLDADRQTRKTIIRTSHSFCTSFIFDMFQHCLGNLSNGGYSEL